MYSFLTDSSMSKKMATSHVRMGMMWWCLQGRCQWTETQVGLDYDLMWWWSDWDWSRGGYCFFFFFSPKILTLSCLLPGLIIREMSVLRGEYVSFVYLTTRARWMVLVIGFWVSMICDCKIGSGLIWITTWGKRQELIGIKAKVVYSYRLLNNTIAQSLQSWFNELALNLPWYYGSSDGKTYVGKGCLAYMCKVVQWQWRWWFSFFPRSWIVVLR